jgi:hypothetical protein
LSVALKQTISNRSFAVEAEHPGQLAKQTEYRFFAIIDFPFDCSNWGNTRSILPPPQTNPGAKRPNVIEHIRPQICLSDLRESPTEIE